MVITLFSSCQKLLDYYNVNDTDPKPACDIKSIRYYGKEDNVLYHDMEFFYSAEGKIQGVLESYPAEDPDGAYSSNWEYLYDEQGRLIRTGPLSTPIPHAEIYAYEGNSRMPARDTLIYMAGFVVEHFTYDEADRIIEIASEIHEYTEDGGIRVAPGGVVRYYYDLRGNRQADPLNPQYQGLIQYNDSPSLYSLDPAFQIQYKNWSKNSAIQADMLNSQGLPLKTSERQRFRQPFISMRGGYTLTYSCE